MQRAMETEQTDMIRDIIGKQDIDIETNIMRNKGSILEFRKNKLRCMKKIIYSTLKIETDYKSSLKSKKINNKVNTNSDCWVEDQVPSSYHTFSFLIKKPN